MLLSSLAPLLSMSPRIRLTAFGLSAALLVAGCSVGVDMAQDTIDAADAVDEAPAVEPEAEVQVAPPPPTVATESEPTPAAARPDEQVGAGPSRFADLAGSYQVRVERVLGHDPTAFTQGLLFDGSRMFESRGQYGQSALTEIDPATGDVLRRVDLDDAFFAEGLAHVGDRFIQLTWQEQVAFVWAVETFESLGQFAYDGEGWGLCHDGADLWMSDGSATLTRRDPVDFTPLEVVDVTRDGQPVVRLNELECIQGLVWANVWLTDEIVVVDPASGEVVATIDATGLLGLVEASGSEDVLNGIAYDAIRDVVVLTGKNWPAMFEVELIAQP